MMIYHFLIIIAFRFSPLQVACSLALYSHLFATAPYWSYHMSSFSQKLSRAFLRVTRAKYVPVKDVPGLDMSQPPLYMSDRPIWARGRYLAAMVVSLSLVAVNASELAWNRWTVFIPSEEQKSPDTSEKEGEYVLRPWWHRAGFSLTIMGAAFGFTYAVLWSRTRVIRTMYLLPPLPHVKANPITTASKATTTTQGRVFVQTAAHSNDVGLVLPRKACTLEQGLPTEMVLNVKGMRGDMRLPLADAKIFGKDMLPLQSGPTLLKTWSNETKGNRRAVKPSRPQ